MSKTFWYGAIALAVILVAVYFWWGNDKVDISELITAEVTEGTVSEVVSVSGFVEADNTANLSFPTAGRISDIFVAEGEEVAAGTLLATVGQSRLAAERRAAQAKLMQAEAARDELLNGQTTEERAVTDATVTQAKSAWEQTISTELRKIKNAEISLYSEGLVAYSADPEENATAPTVSGSYTCDTIGEYVLDIYRSDTDSGYSFTINGLEDGIANVTTSQPEPISSCGLEVQFTDGEQYANSEWTIPVPNTRSNTYLTRLSALDLAREQASQNIKAAKQALALAENTALKDTAAPRVEALLSANAAVSVAQSDVARIDALLSDQVIRAPFAGIITNIDKLPGEVATTEPFITLLAQDSFTLLARIPEIDITKVGVDQIVTATFDAKADEVQLGKIDFVTPIATEIDGVAYFETRIALDEKPPWLRAGLNADVDVSINKQDDVPTIPQRFVSSVDDINMVTVYNNGELTEHEVQLGLLGTDGMVEVTNLAVGTTVVAP